MQRTRRLILDYIQRHGPAVVDELAQATEVVSVTVRAHLAVLEREGLVAGREEHTGRAGRPRIYYSLTPKAKEVFPKGYDHLALRFLQVLGSDAGPEGFFQQAGLAWAKELRRETANETPEQRMEAAIRALDRTGCEAEWLSGEGEFHVKMHNCPYTSVVERFPDLCEMERTFLQDYLGVPVRIEESGPACTCCVMVTDPVSAPA